jgi:hypothetical protein
MSNMFDRTLIEQLNDLRQRLANIEAQDSLKVDATTGLPTFPSLTAGSVLFAGTGGLLAQDNANLFWDDTNNRLGVSTVSPTRKFHVVSATAGDGMYMCSNGPSFELGNNAVFVSSTMHALFALSTANGQYGQDAGTVLIAGYGNSRGNLKIDSNYSGTGTTDVVIQPGTGLVGIGVAAPTAKLDVTKVDNIAGADIGRFFANNLTQGIGIGYDRIEAVGSNANQNVNIMSKGTTGFIGFYTNATLRVFVDNNGGLMPNTAGSQNLGNATTYWNDISYKTLTDRGCLAMIAKWATLDGRRISNLEALRELKPHATEKTIYGEVKLDYASVPKHAHKPAPIADEDTFEEVDDPNTAAKVKQLKYRKGEKMGADGVEMTAMFSMMIGAIRELADQNEALTTRLTMMEARQPKP